MKRAGNAWVHATDLPTPFYKHPATHRTQRRRVGHGALRIPRPNVVGVYRWNGANWAREAGLAGPVSTDPFFIGNWGYDLAFNDTGQLLAISDP